MRLSTRRLFAGPLLVLAAGAGLVVSPAPAAAAATATVTATVKTTKTSSVLRVRSAPSLAAEVAGSLRGGQRITVACAVTGQSVRGSVRTTTQWDQLSTGGYVTHAYVAATVAIPRCATTSPQAEGVKAKPVAVSYQVGTVHSAQGKVNIRKAPSTSAPVARTVLNGATVNGVCGVVGTLVSGTVRSTTQWNRLTDGTYISHAYVVTPTLHLCPGASTAPVVQLTTAQFVASSAPGAQRGWREYGVPASVTMAQAILESGWGRSGLAAVDKNYFGIKCQNGRYGTLASGCHDYPTHECTKAGTCFSTTATFRTYATMANSFRDHGNFLRVNSRYQPAFAYTKDANKFIWQVWKAGYATDPHYYTEVTTLMASYNLYQYDTWK